MSLHKLFKSKQIYWIDSFSTLRRWVIRDLETNNYLETIVINREGTGKRYMVPVQNIDKFIDAFHRGELYESNEKCKEEKSKEL